MAILHQHRINTPNRGQDASLGVMSDNITSLKRVVTYCNILDVTDVGSIFLNNFTYRAVKSYGINEIGPVQLINYLWWYTSIL